MRVAVVGPGAIGATFGAAAEEAGHEVVLCGRRPGPAPVVERPDGGEHPIAAEVESDPSATDGPVPWVLLAVKAHQTAGAADWLRALCGPETTVAVLQNGVEHRALVGPLAGDATVLPTVVWCPSEMVAPGRVQQRGEARLTVPDVAVARAEGAGLDAADAEAVVDRLASFPPDLGTSILFDRLAGRPMEWDARNGVVCRLGRAHGIETPVSDVLVPLLAALDEAPA